MNHKAGLISVLCVVICFLFAIPAAAADARALPGWDLWTTIDHGSHVTMQCPDKNISADVMLGYVSKLISENQRSTDIGYKQYQLTFTYTRDANTWSGVINFMTGEVNKFLYGLWPCPDTYAWVSASAGKTASEYQIHLLIEIAGAGNTNSPAGRLYSAVKSIGDAAKATSSNKAEQLRYAIDRLCAGCSYTLATPQSHEAYGALVDGKAVCGGYTESVSILCRYLEIPCVRVSSGIHVWNSVYIDGAWSHLDATWGDSNDLSDFFLVAVIPDNSGAHAYNSNTLAADQAAALRRAHEYTAPAHMWRVARALEQSDVMRGDGHGNLRLNTILTRAEAVALAIRLIPGAEENVLSNSEYYITCCPYQNAPLWVRAYLGYGNTSGILSFDTKIKFDEPVTSSDFAKLLGNDLSSERSVKTGEYMLRSDAALLAGEVLSRAA